MPDPARTIQAAAPTPAPASAARAPAPAHSRLAPALRQAEPPAIRLGEPKDDVAPGTLELKGMAEFTPPPPIADFLDARKPSQPSTVNACFGTLAQGPITVITLSKGKYRVRRQLLPLTHSMFAAVAEVAAGLTPGLIVNVEGARLTGEVGLASGKKIEELSAQIHRTPEILGLRGFAVTSLPSIANKLDGGRLQVGLKGVGFRLGGAFSGKFNVEAINENVAFDGQADIRVGGLANGTMEFKRAADGLVTGRALVGLNLSKNVSGSFEVLWDGQAVTGELRAAYSGEKLSGVVILHLMEKGQAEQLETARKAPEGTPAPQTGASSAKKATRIDYVVFGEGNLAFAFTDWLHGTAQVIINPKGYLTIIGKITPQKEFILFEQKDYVKQIFKVEARAAYGLPVVGDIFIFANASLDLFAKLGPAKFFNIVVEGTYSTDPTVAKDFSIRCTLSISAGAGATLRAEAGFGIEILSHDIKAGAGINGTAGVKAYAEATPIIGYREKAVEGQDVKGEWFIRGDLEVAAQPYLGLSGDVFVELETPWWSPLSDHKWVWPLFSKEYPLGGTMGMLVSVDYVFGSGQWPKFDFKPVEFNSEKFMTDMYNDKAKSGSGKEIEQKGKWLEKNSAAAEPPAKTSPKGNAAPGKPAAVPPAKSKPVASKKSGKPVDPNAKTKEGKSVKQLQEAAAKKGKNPAGKDVAKGVGKEDSTKKDKARATRVEALEKGLAALDALTARYAKAGATKKEMATSVNALRRASSFKTVFKSIDVIDGGATWDYEYIASPANPAEKKKGPKKAKDLNIAKPVMMKGYPHTLSAQVSNNHIVFYFASTKRRVQNAIQIGVNQLERMTPKPNGADELIRELNLLKTSLEDKELDEDFVAAGGADPRGGTAKLPPRQWAEAKTSIAANKLFEIALRYNITDLASFFMDVPERRYLPPGYSVRAKLYIRGSGWETARQFIIKRDQTELVRRVKDAINNDDQNAWNQLITEKKIEAGVPMRGFKLQWLFDGTFKYHVDHIRSLAEHWEKGGNNTGDDERWTAAKNETNLQLILRSANLAKGSTLQDDPEERAKYVNKFWVGLIFTSKYAENNRIRAKEIDGLPFRLTEDGPPIK